MNRILSLIFLLWCGAANAQLSGGLMFPGPGTAQSAGGSFTPTSQQSADFLARVAAAGVTLTTARKTLYDTMITGIVNDLGGNTASSTWPKLDALYILAAPDTTTAKLNLASSGTTATFTLSETAGGTWTTDVGYAGNGTSSYLDTTYTPSTNAINYSLSSVSMGVAIQNNRTTANTSIVMGAQKFATYSYLVPLYTGSVFYFELEGTAFPNVANTGTKGFFTSSRVNRTTISLYKNGGGSSSTLANGVADDNTAVSFLIGQSVYIGAMDDAGTAANFSTDQVSAAYIGGGLTSTQAFALNDRINTFLAGLPTPKNVY